MSAKNLYLSVLVFVCGAAVLAVELLGTRVLGPFYGVSLFLWSALQITRQALRNASEEFEAVFMNQLVSAMRKTVGDGGLIQKSQGEKMFEGVLVEGACGN